MSVEIWTNIRDAVREVRPELSGEFEASCRDKPSIITFLDKHFKLDPADLLPSGHLVWENQLMTQVPDILRKVFK